MASYIENFKSKLDWTMPFQRTGAFPIDRTDLFESYADAVKYAAGDKSNPDSRGLCGSSYVGQIITVFENDVVTVYKIEADRSLSEVGRATEGDGKSIVLKDGILSVAGFDAATEGMQPRIVNKGTADAPDLQIEWYKPDTSTVEGLQQTVGQITTTVGDAESGLVKDVADLQANKADKSNVYTKEEIDGKLTGALHYQGTKATFQALLDEVTAGTVTPVTGDVWNITAAGGTDANGTAIEAGDNVIFNGTGWDVSSGTTDLSAYYTSAQVDTELAKKVDKVEGERLITTAEGDKIAASVNVKNSETNGNILIDNVETNVYTLPTAAAGVKGGIVSSTDNNTVAVDANGVASVNKIDSSKIDGVVAEAAKVTNSLKVGTKTFDGSAPVELIAEDIPLPSDVVRTTTIASETATGVVKGSADADKISVAADGTMGINTVSGSKVTGIVPEATKTTNALKAGSKTFDGSAPVEITAEDLGVAKTTDLDSYVKKTDIANDTTAGLVKGSTAADQISVAADGTMGINTVSGSKVNGAVAEATNAAKLGNVAAEDILNNGTSKVKAAVAADKLAAAQNITMSGDITGSASFDGSSEASITTTLKDVGTVGTYTKVTTDSKGRVVSGENLVASDIPELTLAKITDAGALAAKDEVARTDLDAGLIANIEALESASHTHGNKTVIDGITSEKVNSWDNTAAIIDTKADKATTLAGYGIGDAYTKEEVNGMIGGAFHYKGTHNTFAELVAAVTEPLVGDVWNITTAGGTDANGVAIKAGDNVAYNGTGWDVLSGTTDLSAYAKTADVNANLATKADKDAFEIVSGKVDTLDTTVLDPETGLVKKVADNTTAIENNAKAIATNVTNIQTVTNTANENKAAIETLNGDVNTANSVKNLIAASAEELNNAINDITKTDGTIDTKIATHNTAEDAHAALFAAKQNKAISAVITFEVADFVENTSGNGPALKATKAVTGLDSVKNYSPNVSPALASCKAVADAQFYPVAEVSNGALTLYCTNIPTEAIVVNGTFTEIQ